MVEDGVIKFYTCILHDYILHTYIHTYILRSSILLSTISTYIYYYTYYYSMSCTCHVLNYDKYFIIFLIFFVIASPSRLFDTNVIEKWAGIAAKQVLINITRPSKAGHYQNILTY